MERRAVSILLCALIAWWGANAGGAALATAQTPNSLVIGESEDIHSGDPYKTGSILSYSMLINIYDPLVGTDVNLRPVPGLAVSWQVVGPMTWEFKLRHGVKFQDGETFDANAVKFSLDRARDPKTKWEAASALSPIDSVEVVDDSTVRIHTKYTWPLLPQYLAHYGWMEPPQYVQQNGEDALGRHPVGTGPYRFVNHMVDDHIEIEANPDYWGGKPKIDHVTFRAIPSEASRLAELLAGSVDLINLIPPSEFDPIRHNAKLKLVSGASNGIYFLLFNLWNTPPNRPLSNKLVRQAINYAVDRKILISSIMGGVGTPVATFCTPGAQACDPAIIPYPYDPARARALLRQAGYPNGFDISFVTPSGTYPGDRDITLAVAAQLQAIGLHTTVNIREVGVLLTQTNVTKNVPEDVVFLRSTDRIGSAGETPSNMFYSKGPTSLYRNPEFDAILEQAKATLDPAAAKELYFHAQALFENEAPDISLFTAPNVYGLRKDLIWTPRPDYEITVATASFAAK
ncbi:MAG TPA: ABC transporter substrate-binding protein [bacterium]|nr:ABC transporter substrate-binding protein [bacterium]